MDDTLFVLCISRTGLLLNIGGGGADPEIYVRGTNKKIKALTEGGFRGFLQRENFGIALGLSLSLHFWQILFTKVTCSTPR